MPKLHREDFQPGVVAVYDLRLVTREKIVAIAAESDPQPMHLDEAAASAIGGLFRMRNAVGSHGEERAEGARLEPRGPK
jgi:acyl dehydratase